MNENPKSAQRRAHNRKAISSLCKVCGTVHTANALGRSHPGPGHLLPYRVVEPDDLGIFKERRFFTPNGDQAIAPKEWKYASVDEILDHLDSEGGEMVSIVDGKPRLWA